MTTASGLVKNTCYLIAGQIATISLGMVWMAFFSRYIGPEGIGQYAVVRSTLAIVVLFVEFGLQNLVIRSIAQERSLAGKYFVGLLTTKLTLSVVVYGCFFAYLGVRGWGAHMNRIMAVVALDTFVYTLAGAATAIFYAYEKMAYDAGWRVIRAVLVLVGGVMSIRMGFSLVKILLILTGVSVVQLVWNGFFLFRLVRLRSLQDIVWFDWRFNWQLLKRSIPFAILLMIGVVYVNIVILILRWFVEDTQMGYFSAAQRIYMILFVIPAMFLNAVLPTLSSSFAESRQKMANIYRKAYRYILAATVPMAAGIILVAQPTILLIYGEQFAPATKLMQILGLGIFNSVGYVNAPALLAMGKEWFISVVSGVTLVLVASICFFVIPRVGVQGACWAVILGNALGFLIYSTVLFRWLKIRYPFAFLFRVVLSSVAMGSVIYLCLPHIHFMILSFLIAPPIYIGFLWILRAFGPDDIHTLCQLLPARLHSR